MHSSEFPNLTLIAKATFNDWEVVHTLGNQHVRKFNRVFLVKNRKNQSFAVLKHLEITPKNAHLVPLFKQESELNFTSKGTPQTIDFYQDENELFMIRTYLPGIPLSVFWKQLKASERIGFLIQFFKQLMPILDEIHQAEVFHLDLKPSNLLIEKTVEGFNLQIIDFGMSYQRNSTFNRNTLFALGYSAPELILNRLELVNAQTDYYSLGIICWQLYAGKLPLTHANPGIMTNLQITHPLPSDRSIPSDLQAIFTKLSWKNAFKKPPNLLAINEVDQCLREGQMHRYAHLQDVISDLEKINQRSKGGIWNWLRK
jgi:serine/threonine protein kinase